MSLRTIPFSFRVSVEDAEFISRFDSPGATTPSDKLRAIIAEARTRSEGGQDYQGSLSNLRTLTDTPHSRLRSIEWEQNIHSELVARVVHWAEEVLACFVAGLPPATTPNDPLIAELKTLENQLADRVFSLIEAVLRMGTTRSSDCYTSDAVFKRLGPIIEIVSLINSSNKKQ